MMGTASFPKIPTNASPEVKSDFVYEPKQEISLKASFDSRKGQKNS